MGLEMEILQELKSIHGEDTAPWKKYNEELEKLNAREDVDMVPVASVSVPVVENTLLDAAGTSAMDLEPGPSQVRNHKTEDFNNRFHPTNLESTSKMSISSTSTLPPNQAPSFPLQQIQPPLSKRILDHLNRFIHAKINPLKHNQRDKIDWTIMNTEKFPFTSIAAVAEHMQKSKTFANERLKEKLEHRAMDENERLLRDVLVELIPVTKDVKEKEELEKELKELGYETNGDMEECLDAVSGEFVAGENVKLVNGDFVGLDLGTDHQESISGTQSKPNDLPKTCQSSFPPKLSRENFNRELDDTFARAKTVPIPDSESEDYPEHARRPIQSTFSSNGNLEQPGIVNQNASALPSTSSSPRTGNPTVMQKLRRSHLKVAHMFKNGSLDHAKMDANVSVYIFMDRLHISSSPDSRTLQRRNQRPTSSPTAESKKEKLAEPPHLRANTKHPRFENHIEERSSLCRMSELSFQARICEGRS